MMLETGPVFALLGKWATNKALDWLAARLNKPGLKRGIGSALEEWIEMDVPSDLRFNEKDLSFINTYQILGDQTPGGSMGKVCDLFEKKTVPPESLWFEALMERWVQISTQESLEKAVPRFYQLAEKARAEECLRELAKRIWWACTNDSHFVGTTLIEAAQRNEFQLMEIRELLQRNITPEEHEQKLKQREKEFRGNIATAHAEEKFLYEKALHKVQDQLSHLQQSYDETVQWFAENCMELASLKQQTDIPALWIQQAEDALLKGDTEIADAIFKQIHEKAEQAIDQKSQQAAAARYRRGILAEESLRYKEAYDHFTEAARLQPEDAQYLNAAGDIARIMCHYQEAISYYEQALANDLKTYGEGHPAVASRYNNLGSAWKNLGDYCKAVNYSEQALASDLKTYGEDHPSVARKRSNLGEVWRCLGDYHKGIGEARCSDEYNTAIGYYQQALPSLLATYGDDHFDVAICRNNLGLAWKSLGDYRKAINYLEQALASDLKTYGEDHPAVATDRNNLGSAWDGVGDFRKAIGFYNLALASDLKTYGEDHLDVAKDRYNLGAALESLGEFQKAVGYFEQALAVCEAKLGREHHRTVSVRNSLKRALGQL